MDYTITLGIWAVAITGPCVISWLAGDLAGAERVRRLYGTGLANTGPQAGNQTPDAAAFRVESWCVEGAIRPLAAPSAQSDPCDPCDPCEPRTSARERPPVPLSSEEKAARAERRHQLRMATLSGASGGGDMEPFPIVIRKAIDAPDPQAALNRFRCSVESLQADRHRAGRRQRHEGPGARPSTPIGPTGESGQPAQLSSPSSTRV